MEKLKCFYSLRSQQITLVTEKQIQMKDKFCENISQQELLS